MINVPERIKAICRQDGIRKNFRVKFPNGEHADLTNANIEEESVTMTESLASSGFRFGMCEASSLEFNAEIERNIRGITIDAQIEIDISDESEDFISTYGHTSSDVDFPFYPISYGSYIVKTCTKQKNGLRRIQAYTQIIGDSQVTAEGTAEWVEYGLNPVEKAKMELEVLSAPYTMNLPQFVWSNLSKPGVVNAEKTEVPCTIEEVELPYQQQINLYWNRLDEQGIPETSYYAILFDKTELIEWEVPNSEDLYYAEFEGDWIMPVDLRTQLIESIESYTGHPITDFWIEDRKDLRGVYGGLYRLLSGKNSILCGALNFTAEIGDRISTHNMNAQYPVVYPHINLAAADARSLKESVSFQIGNEWTLSGTGVDRTITAEYENNIKIYKLEATFPTQTMSFPRTLASRAGRKTYYELDYEALFNEGVSVTKKDKEGNEQTIQYKFSYRDMMEAHAELQASFGTFWRRDNAYSFKPISGLNQLLPSNGLFPTNPLDEESQLYPHGANAYIPKALISEVEWDDTLTRPYASIVCTCTPSDATRETKISVQIETTDEPSAVYDLSDNYLISTFPETYAAIEDYMRTIGDALKGLRYMPASIEMQGLPYIEAGDWIEFDTIDGTMLTNVLRQTIKGVQNLRTTIESEG